MRSRKSIKAEWGLGPIAYIEPIPSFRPPSLPKQPEQQATKLMQRLLKEDEEKVKQFRKRLLLKQTKTVMPMVTTVQIDPSPLFVPPLFFSSKRKRK